MAWAGEDSTLDRDIFDAMAEFLTQTLERVENIADEFGVPPFCAKALHLVDTSVTMKDLGRLMRCDRSFVTAIADSLEQRGLARRESCVADRRIKNLVLTPAGIALKNRLEREMLGQMPWSHALDVAERESLLRLLRKMISAGPCTPTPPTGGERAGEVSDELITTSPGDG